MLAGRTGNYARYEIERKFVLSALPPDAPGEFVDLHDTYLPGSNLRLRVVRDARGEIQSRNLTQKTRAPSGDASINVMTSIYLSEGDLAALGELRGAVIEKRRHFVVAGGTRVTFDVFKGPHEGLLLAEVEFGDEAARDAFAPPDAGWVEVTGDPRYSCGSLALSRYARETG